MRETYDVENVKALVDFIASAAPGEQRTAVMATLADLHRKPEPWDGKWWSNQPVKAGPPPKTVVWDGTPLVVATVTRGLNDTDPAVRKAAIAAAELTHDTDAGTILAAQFSKESDAATQAAILRALSAIGGDPTVAILETILNDSSKNPALLPDAIAGAGRLHNQKLDPLLARLAETSSDSTIAVAAVNALASEDSIPLLVKLLHHADEARSKAASAGLARIGGDAVLKAVFPLLDDPRAATRRAAITAIAPQKNKDARPKFVAAAKDPQTHAQAIEALALTPDPAQLDLFVTALSDKDHAVADAAEKAIRTMKDKVLKPIEDQQRKTAFDAPTLRRLQVIYDRSPDAKKGPLFAGAAAPADPVAYDKFAADHKGNVENGQRIFESATCIACHRIDGKGGEVGPDLSSVGSKYGRPQLIESVLYPSKVILEGYQQTIVELKNGDMVAGVLRGETAEQLQIIDTAGLHPIAKKDIESQRQSQLSMMPEGLFQTMSTQDFADLISYLESLKEKPKDAK